MRTCLDCSKDISGAHFNRKRCKPCARRLVRRPVGKLTKAQEKIVRRWAGKIYARKVAEKAGVPVTRLKRWARDNRVSLNALAYKREVVEQVCRFYEKHGRKKTQETFPDVKVRSIVERYKDFSPRQEPWKGEQLIEAVKMAGLISKGAQARWFNRPGANQGAIRSLWIKKLNCAARNIHGLPRNHAKHLVNHRARYIQPTGDSRDGKPCKARKLILWAQLEHCLKDGVPDFLRDAISAMADFQRWLFETDDVKAEVLKMIKERES